MTAERAIENLYAIRTVYQMDLSEPEDRALAMAIQALEYDDAKYHEEHGDVIVDKAVWDAVNRAVPMNVLDDIKSEIERKANSGQWCDAYGAGLLKALAIIDKHIGERSNDGINMV